MTTTTTTKENPVTDSGPGSGGQHDAKDAHVQVLTAEVRTLVVGSRQVTMSVYNQLDYEAPGDIAPFGRVEPRNALDEWVYVVGRYDGTGALVRSSLPYSTWGSHGQPPGFRERPPALRPASGQHAAE